MPFDGFGLPNFKALDNLNAVIDMLGTKEKWCKGKLSTPEGAYCIRGAIMMQTQCIEGVVVRDLEPVILEAIHEFASKKYGRYKYGRIESFNDDRETQHEHVVQVLELARSKLITKAFEQQFPTLQPPKTRFRRVLDYVFQWK